MRNCIVSILFFYLSIGWVSSQEPFQELFSTEKVPSIVRRANVAYDSVSFQSGIPHVPLYIANGIVGGSFDHMGFQSRPNTGMPHGRTALGYIGHYDLADHGSHVQFPLAIIDARFADGSTILNLMDAHDYKQELDVYTGTLNTAYDLFGKTTINSFAHQAIPNLFVMKIDRKTSQRGKELVLTIECDASGAQNNHFNRKVDPVTVDFDVQEDLVRVKSKTDITETNWIIQCTGAGFETNGTTLTVKLQNGQNLLKVLVKRDDCPGEEVLENSYEDLYQLHSKAWEDAWQTSWVDFPDDVAQDTWTRMKYYTICNFPPLTEKPMIPTGLNSNIWGFTFPQDVYYVAENLPRLGHFERSEKALQYWLDIVPEIKRYCERIIGVEGVYYPWEMPFQDIDKFEIDGVKGPNSYQLHNQAYVAAMVWHYYEITKDQAFLEKYFPILEEIWQFYANITFLDDERGTFDIYHEHSRGQDEASSTEGKLKNLLCASYSAEYTARNYLKACEKVNKHDKGLSKKAKDILQKGYTREPLMKTEGFYSTYEGDNRPLNEQKHPVQLNPIAYLPMPDMVNSGSPVEVAWKKRYLLTEEAHKPITKGWTIGEFALASARMKDPMAFKKDLSAIQPCHAADPRWIQMYESSFWEEWHENKSYYFPMMGLYLQAYTDCIVQDWQGYTDLFGCLLPEWKNQKIAFKGICTKNGVSVSGYWDDGKISIELKPINTDSITLQVSQAVGTLKASGQAKGPATFQPNENVTLMFDKSHSIIISNK